MEAIGDTPLINLKRIKEKYGLKADIFAKLERNNPTGSIKDRAARQMVLSALNDKKIDKDSVLVEATSGNMGISLASICASLGLKLVIYMPENASKERRTLMKALGANLVLTPKGLGMEGSLKEAEAFVKKTPNAYLLRQFENPDNVKAHYLTTGPEIYNALEGKIDCFVASFGSGGSISGIALYLKSRNPSIKIIGIEPASSPLLSLGKAGPHKIQGIGANFVPANLQRDQIDEIIVVNDEEAYRYTRELAKYEGLLCGISSGANLAGAIKIAQREKYQHIVTLLPDNAERYLSVEGLYE